MIQKVGPISDVWAATLQELNENNLVNRYVEWFTEQTDPFWFNGCSEDIHL